MKIDFKRAVIIGVVLWVIIFFEVSILMFGFNLKPGLEYYIIHYFFLTIFTLIGLFFYYKSKYAKRGALGGGLIGLIFIVTGIILDALITIPLFIHDYAFFLDPYLLGGYLWAVIICIIFGAVKK